MAQEIILVMGYPASGKSTLAGTYQKQGYEVLNRDASGGAVTDLLPRLASFIKEGKNVVLDNLFPTKTSRKPFIDQAIKSEVPIRCVWVKTSIEQSQFNACMRMMKLKGKILAPNEIAKERHPNLFPPAVLFQYRKQLEEPSTSEGFDSVTAKTIDFVLGKEYSNEAVIFDFDGTLRITASGNIYPTKPNDVLILPGRDKIKTLLKGRLAFGASNQSGIHKKSLTEQQAKDCFDQTVKLLRTNIEYQFCPHQSSPITCWCRKPMPGIAVYFIEKYKLNPGKCVVVGDMTSDETFAKRAGMNFMWEKDFFKG